jgi:hypothetical protein
MTENLVDDQLITGLIRRLPPAGQVWPEVEREAWMGAIRQVFKILYREPAPRRQRKPRLKVAAE